MKNRFLSIMLVLVMLLAMFAASGCGKKSSGGSSGDTTITDTGNDDDIDEDDVNITETKTSQMEYETYDNSLISLQIPKGWKVDIPHVDYIHYSFKAYDPENPDYMFLFILKLEGFLKSEEARSAFASMYPDAIFSKISPIDPQTTEAFYGVWNNNAKLSNELDFGYEYFPYLNNFTVVENLGQISFGGDLLRATYENAAGSPMQGLFTASVMDAGSYNMFGVDLAPLNVYHTVMMMSPDDDFVNWQPVYDYCIGTLRFSDTFMTGFGGEESVLVSTIKANQEIYDQVSDMIMDSWEQRNNSYDIMSQKQSDATLGYERVYDTETNEVYRAYNGFTDSYSGSRYQPITDDMYTSTISGYIEK